MNTLNTLIAAPGLAGVVVADTAIGDVRGDEGFFHYRQYDATQLAEHRTFEQVWHLVLFGDLPAAEGAQSTEDAAWTARTQRALAVDETIRTLVAWSGGNQALGPSTISVLDHRNDYGAIYRYLRSLGIMNMSFLLPDRSHDQGFSADDGDAESYGRCLSDLFQAWFAEDNPDVNVRQVKEVIRHFQNTEKGPPEPPGEDKIAYQIIVAQSDGTVSVDDSLIPALDWFKGTPRVAIADTSLPDFLADRVFGEIRRANNTIATACRDCDWRGVCRSGDLENRYADGMGFDNPSVYCSGYQRFFTDVCGTLLANNYPVDLLEDRIEQSFAAVDAHV